MFRPNNPILLKWLLIGLAIRIAIMPLFAHPDLLTFDYWGLVLKQTHQLVPSVDGPIIYYLFAFLQTIFGPILPKSIFFGEIRSNIEYTPPTANFDFALSEPGINTLIFVSKIPYLVFDLLLAFLLPRFVDDEKQALTVFRLWMLNPVSLFVSYFVGQYDVIPTFLFMLALVYFKKSKIIPTMLLLGLAGAVKFFPMFFVLPLAIVFLKGKRPKVAAIRLLFYVSLSLIPLLVGTILLLYLTPVYYQSANAAAPANIFIGYYGTRLYVLGIPSHPLAFGLFQFTSTYSFVLTNLGANEIIYLFFASYILFLLYIVYSENWPFEKLWKISLVFLLSYYALSLFYPQWFLWMQPLFILLVVKHVSFLKLYATSIVLFFVYIWYWDASLTTALITPVVTQALSWPGPIELLYSLALPAPQVINILHTFLSTVLVGTAILILRLEGFIPRRPSSQ